MSKSKALLAVTIALPELHVALVDGEYRINFVGGREATAYYTNDADDAINTGRAMLNPQHKAKRLTLNMVNEAVRAAGMDGMTLYQGYGYLYFFGEGVVNQSHSVAVCRLNHLTMERWLDEAREAAGRTI